MGLGSTLYSRVRLLGVFSSVIPRFPIWKATLRIEMFGSDRKHLELWHDRRRDVTQVEGIWWKCSILYNTSERARLHDCGKRSSSFSLQLSQLIYWLTISHPRRHALRRTDLTRSPTRLLYHAKSHFMFSLFFQWLAEYLVSNWAALPCWLKVYTRSERTTIMLNDSLDHFCSKAFR